MQAPPSVIVAGKNHVDIVASANTTDGRDASESGRLLGRCYIPADCLDPEALKQVQAMCSHPAVKDARVMPDCHKGNGCCIGFTCKLTRCISPAIISGDVACGITAVPLPAAAVERRGGLQRVLNIIHESVPMGGGAGGVHQVPLISLEQFLPFLDEATQMWRDFALKYYESFGINIDAPMCARYSQFLPEHNDTVRPFMGCRGGAAAASSSSSSNSNSAAASSSFSQGMGSAMGSAAASDASSATGAIAGMMEMASQQQLQEPTAAAAAPSNEPPPPPQKDCGGMSAATSSASTAASGGSGSGSGTKNKKNVPQFQYSLQWLQRRCQEWGLSLEGLKSSLGTLGGGNHFIEVGVKTYVLDEHGPKTTTTTTTKKKSGSNAAAAAAAAAAASASPTSEEQQQAEDDTDPRSERFQAKGRTVEPAENDDDLPEYLLSVHSGSRAVGGALYRYWIKRCEQLSVARTAAAASASGPSSPTGKGGSPVGGASKAVAASNAAAASASAAAGGTVGEVAAALDAAAAASGPHQQDDDAELVPFNSSFLLTSPEDVGGYYADCVFAFFFAQMNRRAMLSVVLCSLGDQFRYNPKDLIETVHNYIDVGDFVVRKGAVRAELGKPLIIGLNMREGLWLARGKGNSEWNFSGPHGCGRVVPRGRAAAPSVRGTLKGGKKAAEDPKVKQFKQEMCDVVSNTVSAETYDERPSVYRSSALVRSLLSPAVELVCRYKTILNAKGGDVKISG